MTEPWWSQMINFVTYMRKCGHSYTWLHWNGCAHPIGVVEGEMRADNDNG